MSDPLLTVSAAGLRPAGVTLSSAEAVACVLLSGEALQWSADAPDPSRVILRGDGRINVTGSPFTKGAVDRAAPADQAVAPAARAGASVESYARLLHRLLPEAGDGGQTPGALRLTVARGLGALDAPPFASVDDFRAGIARFLTHTPEEHIVAAVVRWAEAMGSQSEERLPERRVAGPRVDTLRRMLLEADLERYALVTGAPVAELRLDAPDRRTPPPKRKPVERPAPMVFTALDPVPERPVRWRAFAAVAVFAAVVGWAAANLVREGGLTLPDAVESARAVLPALPVALPGDRDAVDATATPAPEPAAPATAAVAEQETTPEPEPKAERERDFPADTESTAGATGDQEAATAGLLSDDEVPTGALMSSARESDLASRTVARGGDRAMESYWRSGTEDRTVIDAGMVTYSGFRLANVIDGEHHTDHVRLSPDGSRVAFDSDRDGERGVYVADRNGTGVQRISGRGIAQAPAWAPDSRRVAFLRAEVDDPRVRNLWMANLDSGEERRLTAWRYGETSPADWFSDGRRLSYAHDANLYVMDLSTGASRKYDSPVLGRGIASIAVSPAGERIAFQVLNDGIWLLDLSDGSTRRALDDPTIQQLAWSPTGTSLAYHSRRAGHWAVLVLTR